MKQSKERRGAHDRRQREIGPPKGWSDRRRSRERRIPGIAELEVSEAEWLMYFGSKGLAPAEG